VRREEEKASVFSIFSMLAEFWSEIENVAFFRSSPPRRETPTCPNEFITNDLFLVTYRDSNGKSSPCMRVQYCIASVM